MAKIVSCMDDRRVYAILNAINNGMTSNWEFKERFGNVSYTLNKLKTKGLVVRNTARFDNYTLTEEGKQWLKDYKNGNIKSK